MVSLLSAVFLLRCLFFEWVRGMQMLGAVCLKYLNPVLQCFAGFEGQITHTHTHTHTHTRWRNGRWELQIYQPAIQKRGISIWQQTHFSFSIALFLQINILKAWYEWKESATFFCEARNLIKNVSDYTENWFSFGSQMTSLHYATSMSLERAFSTYWEREGGTGWTVGHDLCAFSQSFLLWIHSELFILTFSHRLAAVSHYCD